MQTRATAFLRRAIHPFQSIRNTQPKSRDPSTKPDENPEIDNPSTPVPPEVARRILISLMFPAMLMPLISSMSRVALPIIQDEFFISVDMTAWVATAFTLPFMILMPIYGRLSDGVGKRRLILTGLVITTLGTAMTVAATDLVWIMAGRGIQGVGAAGMMPLGIAFLSSIFPPDQRGKALGTWSSIGPTVACLGPLFAGFLVDSWGWRAAFAPPLAVGLLAFFVVVKFVPAGLSQIQPRFWRTFDWVGVGLLASMLTSFLFYLSSRPITGVDPFFDWRLLTLTLLLLASFLWWERRRADPFVSLHIFTSRRFSLASLLAALRMMTMAGAGFLVPFYLIDIHQLKPTEMGLMLMITPGSMMFMVRFGGLMTDRWGSRWPITIGFAMQLLVMLTFSYLPETASLGWVILILICYGLGVGLMLAALHQAATGNVSKEEMGQTAGLYSMIRFSGMAVGTAIAGVLLQNYIDQGTTMIDAYQSTYFFFVGTATVGLIISTRLRA